MLMKISNSHEKPQTQHPDSTHVRQHETYSSGTELNLLNTGISKHLCARRSQRRKKKKRL